ncbi:MAG: cyclic-di-AMP receptor [Chloroflexota bacterium]
MKMIVAIVDDTKCTEITQALLEANFRITRLASTGSLLRVGMTTLMVGTEDEQLDQALNVIRERFPPSSDPNNTQATVYVLNVTGYKRV